MICGCDVTTQPSPESAIRSIHLLGICGSGMGALAAMLQEAGYLVRGSDENAYPPMSTFLSSRGIPVFRGYDPQNLEPAPDLVVVGNVIRRANPEVVSAMERALTCWSMPQTLWHLFLKSHEVMVVAGTHGKTTTAALLCWLLTTAGLDPGSLLGGLMLNLGQSYRLGRGRYFVVEGDEYDTAFFDKRPKFLHYRPRICVLTGIEFDHADIFSDLEEVEDAFRALLDRLPADGLLVVNADNARASSLGRQVSCRVVTYGLHLPADYRVEEATYSPGRNHFRLSGPQGFCSTFVSRLAGAHNLCNATAVAAVARELELSSEVIQLTLDTFQGVARRQQVVGRPNGVTVIDDFAHHPTAVRATIEALLPGRSGGRLWAVFEPRTNSSRRRVFQESYGSAFDGANVVVIKEPAHLESIPAEERLSARQLVADISARGPEAHHFVEVEAIAEFIRSRVKPGDIVLIMSSGPFGQLASRLLERLEPG